MQMAEVFELYKIEKEHAKSRTWRIAGKRILDYFLPETQIESIPPIKIRAWVRSMQAERLSNQTAHIYYSHLRNMYSIAAESGSSAVFPSFRKLLPKLNNERDRVATEKELKLLREAMGEAQWLVYTFILSLGLRRKEAFDAIVDDVDWVGNVIKIRTSKGLPVRYLPINAKLRKVIKKLCAGKGPEEFILTPFKRCKSRAHIGQRWWTEVWAPAIRATGIKGLQFRDSRHWFGTTMARENVAEHKIMRAMGHTNARTTKRYVNLAVRDLRGAMPCL